MLLALRAITAPPEPPARPDLTLEHDEQRSVIRAALATLSPRERELLLLQAEGFSYREIARVLGIRETSVGTLLRRARTQFARALGGSRDAYA